MMNLSTIYQTMVAFVSSGVSTSSNTNALGSLRGALTPENTILNSEHGAIKIEIDHISGEDLTFSCQTIVGYAISQAYQQFDGDDDDLRTHLKAITYINEDRETDSALSYGLYYRWLTGLYFYGWSCRMCHPYAEDELNNQEDFENFDLLTRLGDKHKDYENAVMNVLLNSSCAAFHNITLVKIVNGATPSNVIVPTDNSNQDINIQIDWMVKNRDSEEFDTLAKDH